MKRRFEHSGSVLIEFIVVCPILVLLVSMILQFSQIWIARQVTAYAAYCATRATLCVRADEVEEKKAAQKAAESVCAWLCLAGLSSDTISSTTETINTNWDKYHETTAGDISPNDLFYKDVSESKPSSEYEVPGLGSVPGSSSRFARVEVKVVKGGENPGYAEVTVKFKFALMLPLAGRMISWAVSHPDDETWDDANTWNETVLDDEGNAVERKRMAYGSDGRYPYIELTETCVLPRPYTTENLPQNAYKYGGDL